MDDTTRRIETTERSGVLVPANLSRFSAGWLTPAAEVRDVVETYWTVNWRFTQAERVHQRIVDFPAITVSIEAGDVPAAFVVSAVRRRAFRPRSAPARAGADDHPTGRRTSAQPAPLDRG